MRGQRHCSVCNCELAALPELRPCRGIRDRHLASAYLHRIRKSLVNKQTFRANIKDYKGSTMETLCERLKRTLEVPGRSTSFHSCVRSLPNFPIGKGTPRVFTFLPRLLILCLLSLPTRCCFFVTVCGWWSSLKIGIVMPVSPPEVNPSRRPLPCR